MARYMDMQQYNEIMAENGYRESRAVRLFLSMAKYSYSIETRLQAQLNATPDCAPIVAEVEKLDRKRVQYVWQAIETAEAESNQQWLYLEDSDEFMNMLMIKYEGDLSKADELERKQVEYLTLLDKEERKMKQNKGIR